jgi:enoyl-CoA hydratase/carnithine racemase
MSILFEKHGDVELIRFNRPEKKNALTGEMYNAANEALKTADARGVRAFVFAGSPGAFTAGNDLMDFLKYTGAGETPAFHFIRQLAINDVPLIAAVDGLAVGVGTTMLFHCDQVFASPRATFKMPFVDLGVVPEAASSLLAPQLWGYQKSVQYMLLSEGFDASEAKRLNLVTDIIESEALEAKALSIAAKFASKPQQALRTSRRLLRGSPETILNAMSEESKEFSKALNSDEAKAIFMAFFAGKK